MITGARAVLGPVPACHVDPFLLAQGQTPETYGYIAIVYPGPWCDVLFFRGQTIRYAGRLRQHHRFLTREGVVRETYLAYRSDPSTAVWLYTAQAEPVRAFLSTFYYVPLLKMDLQLMSRKQRARLFGALRIPRCLIERALLQAEPPLVDLQICEAAEGLPRPPFSLSHGILSLYDIDRNQEMMREMRHAAASGREPPAEEEKRGPAEAGPVHPPPVPPAPVHEHPSRVALFGALLRSFRKAATQILGRPYQELEEKAEREIRLEDPEFRADALGEGNAEKVLEIIRFVVDHAGMLRRAVVRFSAATLVAEFYSANHEKLKSLGLVETVEECYKHLNA